MKPVSPGPLFREQVTAARNLEYGPATFLAFPFRTYMGPGKADPDRQVLKIDYNLRANPLLNVRRVLDELVQLSEGFYLGKAHFKWYLGRWQTLAFFSLGRGD